MAMGQESKGMGMTDSQDNAALEREEITSRVAHFKATQQKFEREREEYFVTTLENARHSESGRHSIERPPFWS
jgi:chorismate mutase